MVSPHNCTVRPGGPGGERGEIAGVSIIMKVSREGREYHWRSGERGESPQLKVESVREGDHGSN